MNNITKLYLTTFPSGEKINTIINWMNDGLIDLNNVCVYVKIGNVYNYVLDSLYPLSSKNTIIQIDTTDFIPGVYDVEVIISESIISNEPKNILDQKIFTNALTITTELDKYTKYYIFDINNYIVDFSPIKISENFRTISGSYKVKGIGDYLMQSCAITMKYMTTTGGIHEEIIEGPHYSNPNYSQGGYMCVSELGYFTFSKTMPADWAEMLNIGVTISAWKWTGMTNMGVGQLYYSQPISQIFPDIDTSDWIMHITKIMFNPITKGLIQEMYFNLQQLDPNTSEKVWIKTSIINTYDGKGERSDIFSDNYGEYQYGSFVVDDIETFYRYLNTSMLTGYYNVIFRIYDLNYNLLQEFTYKNLFCVEDSDYPQSYPKNP